MDLDRLHKIISETTQQYRKGPVFEGTPELVAQAEAGSETLEGGGVLEVYAMPHQDEITDNIVPVDMHFITIGVDKEKAEARKADLIALLDDYPDPEQMNGGPSYIAVGAVIGDQGAAFQLFALGKVLGLWDVITPEMMGARGAQARELAGLGYIMITGYRRKAA